MKNAKKILVTTVTREIFIARSPRFRESILTSCPICSDVTELLDLETAVTAFSITMRELMHKIKTEELHCIDTPSQRLMVCRSSLAAVVRERAGRRCRDA